MERKGYEWGRVEEELGQIDEVVVAVFGFLWLLVVACGCLQLTVVYCGRLWPLLAGCGCWNDGGCGG